jgi:hypothetical protein
LIALEIFEDKFAPVSLRFKIINPPKFPVAVIVALEIEPDVLPEPSCIVAEPF